MTVFYHRFCFLTYILYLSLSAELFSDETIETTNTTTTTRKTTVSDLISRGSVGNRIRTASKLLSLQRHIRNRLDLLLDIHGHQILIDGVFNGDCHPGK